MSFQVLKLVYGLIELVDVWKSYGASQVLKGVNLNVREGEFISIRGKSGVGKPRFSSWLGSWRSRTEVKLSFSEELPTD
jgi:polar amino acid transport system ATP-binding protein